MPYYCLNECNRLKPLSDLKFQFDCAGVHDKAISLKFRQATARWFMPWTVQVEHSVQVFCRLANNELCLLIIAYKLLFPIH